MGPEEMKEFARIVGEKLNRSNGPTYILIPKRGWSDADKSGMELFEPKTNQILVEELRKIITPNIPIEEMDVHISDPAFALRAVEVLDHMIRAHARKEIDKGIRR
jgi:uncharacterized protein (UPF0261 family)